MGRKKTRFSLAYYNIITTSIEGWASHSCFLLFEKISWNHKTKRFLTINVNLVIEITNSNAKKLSKNYIEKVSITIKRPLILNSWRHCTC